ncbi:4082_t:CDS:2, partial [Racocetra persica]
KPYNPQEVKEFINTFSIADEMRIDEKFQARQFHSSCDNKGATIVIRRVKNKDHFIGGYNPLDWSIVLVDNSFYKRTED